MFGKKSPIAILLVIVMAMSLLVCGCSKAKTPAEHLYAVHEKALNDSELMDDAVAVYEQMLTSITKSSGASDVRIALNVSEELTSMAESLVTQYGVAFDLSWLHNIVLEFDAVVSTQQYALDLGLGLNDSAVLNGGFQMNMETGEVYAGVPQINSQWIGANLNELYGEDVTGIFGGSLAQSTAMAAALAEDLPESAAIETMTKEFVLLALGKITQVESLEETLTVGGMEQKYTALKATVSQQELVDMAVAVLEKAQTDATMKAIVQACCNYSNGFIQMDEELNGYSSMVPVTVDDFYAEISAMLEDVKATEIDPEAYVYLYTYVDKKDEIRGYAVEDPETQEKYSAVTVWDGDKFVSEAVLPEGVIVTGTGTEVNDAVTGTFDVVIEDVKRFSLELENMKTAEGKVSGTVTLIPGEPVKELILNLVDGAAFAPLLKSAEFGLELVLAEGEASLNVLLNDSMLFGMDLSAEIKDAAQVEAPTNVVFVNAEDDLYTWMSGMSFGQVYENLSAAGVPAEYVAQLQQIIYMSLGLA